MTLIVDSPPPSRKPDQASNGVLSGLDQMGLVGPKSRRLLAARANHRIDASLQPCDRLTRPPHATIPSQQALRAQRTA
jgi:hypothetical protein